MMRSSTEHSREWTDEVTSAVLRLGYTVGTGPDARFIQSGHRKGQYPALDLLANESRLYPASAIYLASIYFARQITDERNVVAIKDAIPDFVHNFLRRDDHLLAELIRRTREANLTSGAILAEMTGNYLSKRWLVQDYGEQRTTRLRQEVSRAGTQE